MPDIGPSSDNERFGQKFLWIRPRFGGVNLSCGMAGETDLTAEEVREVIVRLRDAIGDPPLAEERLREALTEIVGFCEIIDTFKGQSAIEGIARSALNAR